MEMEDEPAPPMPETVIPVFRLRAEVRLLRGEGMHVGRGGLRWFGKQAGKTEQAEDDRRESTEIPACRHGSPPHACRSALGEC